MRDSDKEFSFFRGKILLRQPKEHRVSIDLVVFLSKIRGIKRNIRVADLGAGFGFLSIVLAKKYGSFVYALERDKKMLELLKENVNLNSLESKVLPVEVDIRNVEEIFKRGEFGAIVTNPPFFPKDYGVRASEYHFEGDTTLKDFVKAGSYLLRDGGYFNVLIPAFRLYELFLYMNEFNLPPRFLTPIYPTLNKNARLAVVVSIRNVPGPIHVERAVFINDPEGGYTQEVERLLEGFI